jgi:hypothetical protein
VKPSAWRYNWTTLLLGDINMWTWPSRLGASRIWDNKIWSWILRDSDKRLAALARTRRNCKLQTHPLFREGTPHQQTHNCLTIKKKSGHGPQMGAWHQARLTIGSNIILNLTVTVSADILVQKCSAYTKLLIPPFLNPYMAMSEQRSWLWISNNTWTEEWLCWYGTTAI